MTSSTAEIALTDPAGKATVLGDYRASPLIVILVRYFGCLPCQDYLGQLTASRNQFPADADVVAVGGSAPYQARWLRDSKGVSLPLLLDPEERVRAVAEVGNLSVRELTSWQGATNYLKAMRHGYMPQVPTSDARKAPGIVVFDPEFNPLWVHRGETLGDYPTVDELIATVGALTA